MTKSSEWQNAKDSLRIGTKVRATVKQHWPFGILVAIPGCAFTGLVKIHDFKDEGRMTAEEYPAVGAVVLGHRDQGHQIWLGMRPSQLQG